MHIPDGGRSVTPRRRAQSRWAAGESAGVTAVQDLSSKTTSLSESTRCRIARRRVGCGGRGRHPARCKNCGQVRCGSWRRTSSMRRRRATGSRKTSRSAWRRRSATMATSPCWRRSARGAGPTSGWPGSPCRHWSSTERPASSCRWRTAASSPEPSRGPAS